MHLTSVLGQVWPPFVLVTGLLLVGLVANHDGLFERAGVALERLPSKAIVLYGASLSLVALVTAVLNLDTAAVFLTPVLIHAARHRGVDEEPFLYGTIYMVNASSLFLVGSNLTNLLVLAHQSLSAGAFAAQAFVIAVAASGATMLGLLLFFSRGLQTTATPPPTVRLRRAYGLGLPGALLAAVMMIALPAPALAVLALGVALTAIELVRGRLQWREVHDAIGPLVLVGLFLLSVALGLLARSWSGPAQLVGSAGSWGVTGVGALASVLINNLPAAVLLSARPLAHPRALLLGLNLGPNLAATGSLSALLWWRAAKQVSANPSFVTFSKRGVPLAIFAMAVALCCMQLS